MGDKRERDMDHTDLEATPPEDELLMSLRLLYVSPPLLTTNEGGSYASGEGAKELSCGHEEGANKEVRDRDPVNVKVNTEPKIDVVSNAVIGRSEMESLEDFPMEGEAHPCLFIENVLDVIFKHVVNQQGPRSNVTKDVQSIRLVCRQWRTSMTCLYRQTGKTVTFVYYRYEERVRSWPTTLRNCLVEFVKTMRFSDMIPVQSYQFHLYLFSKKKLQTFREFLSKCGPEAVSLSMDVRFQDAKRNILEREQRNPSGLNLLKLNRLKLRISYDRDDDEMYENHTYGIMSLCQFLFPAAKNLLEFELSYKPSWGDANQPGIVVQQLSLLIVDGIPRTVKQLKLEMGMDEISNLGEMQSQLVRLEFRVVERDNCGLPIGSFQKFLRSQAPTLKHLVITKDSGNRNDIFVEFPCLAELIHLELDSIIMTNVPPSHFAKTFPKLQCLKITEMEAENAILALLSSSKAPTRSLKVIHVPRMHYTYASLSLASCVKKVAKSFPCLTELHICPRIRTMEIMGNVFTYCDNLETLNVSLYPLKENNDPNWCESLFSGISESDCARIKLHDFEMENVNKLQRRPSLLNLTKLRKLVVMDNYYDIGKFTDLSAHFTFLEMENLREIQLPKGIVQFSPRYLGLLRDKHKLIHH